MKNVKFLLLLAFVTSLAWTGCKKGDTGPAGATGPAGPDSVMYSPWITLAFNYVTVDTSGYYADSIAAPSITQAILDSGVVLGYLDFSANNDGSSIIPMSTGSQFGIFEYFSVGIAEVDDYSGDASGAKYRYVVIPGSRATSSSGQRKYNGYTISELKSMSYDKVRTIAASGN